MAFYETVGGKKFCSDISKIAKSLETIADCMKAERNANSIRYIVIRTNYASGDVERVTRMKKQTLITTFDSVPEAQKLMQDDLIAHFNGTGWEPDLVSDVKQINNRGYFAKIADTSAILNTDPTDANIASRMQWQIVSITI